MSVKINTIRRQKCINSSFLLSEKVGFLIRELRSSKKMSGKQLASMIGVSQQQISRYESGKSKLTIDQLETISSAFDMSIWIFMNTLQFNFYIDNKNNDNNTNCQY